MPNALLAQLSHLPPKVRAVHVRAAMVMYLIQNEDTVWVRNNFPILINLIFQRRNKRDVIHEMLFTDIRYGIQLIMSLPSVFCWQEELH